jgi:hypothetical protein
MYSSRSVDGCGGGINVYRGKPCKECRCFPVTQKKFCVTYGEGYDCQSFNRFAAATMYAEAVARNNSAMREIAYALDV